MKKTNTLWTTNFTIITLGTIISAIGGIGTSFAMGVIVFKETESTFLSGLYTALILLPQLLLPLVIGPVVDKFSRKKIIVGLDYLAGIFFILCALLTRNGSFHYGFFVLMGILINTNSIIYSTAYNALYPDLIPEGMYQKGYSVSSMIYPLASTLITPIAALVFDHFGTSLLFAIQGVLLIASASLECFIKVEEKLSSSCLISFSQYITDLKEGIEYLKNEKGLLAIFTYFFFTMFCAQGFATLLVPFFENHPVLTLTSYSLLISAETIGRFISGLVHYTFKLPASKKYTIAASVYLIYEISEGLLMFVAFPVMLLIRFTLGFLGTNSANIRMSAVQSYLPSDKRGRIGSISSLLSFAGVFFGSLTAGILGEYFAYPLIGIGYSLIGTSAVFLIIVRNKKAVSAIYNREI